MPITKGDYTIRVLEDQVRKNKSDIEDLTSTTGLLGIKVVGQVAHEWDLYSTNPPDARFTALDYGDTFAVGTEEPYVFYVKTRANDSIEYDHWFKIGTIQGARGPVGADGTDGTDGITPRLRIGLSGQWEVSYDEGTNWTLTGVQAQGPTGATGPQGLQGQRGPQGPRGDTGGFININGIVATTSALPAPSTLHDLTKAYLVGTTTPYTLYIQVGEDSETAVWTDMGLMNVATYVTVNGSFTGMWDADTKVDKVTTTSTYRRAYTVAPNGAQEMIELGQLTPNPSSIVRRTTSGTVKSGLPSDADDCMTLGYYTTNGPKVVHLS